LLFLLAAIFEALEVDAGLDSSAEDTQDRKHIDFSITISIISLLIDNRSITAAPQPQKNSMMSPPEAMPQLHC
jgi:hypothetical protein